MLGYILVFWLAAEAVGDKFDFSSLSVVPNLVTLTYFLT
jgi:hypothetical protein